MEQRSVGLGAVSDGGAGCIQSIKRRESEWNQGGAIYFWFAKIRFASSSVSLDPMSYQMPGTRQV